MRVPFAAVIVAACAIMTGGSVARAQDGDDVDGTTDGSARGVPEAQEPAGETSESKTETDTERETETDPDTSGRTLAQHPWWLEVTAATAHFAEQSNRYYHALVGVSWFVLRPLELSFQGEYWYFDQRGDDGTGGGVGIEVRWHFLEGPRWSLVLEGGSGAIALDDQVPRTGLAFNFTPRAGLAFTWRPGARPVRVRLGARWQHVSNLFVRGRDENPGSDALLVHAGVFFPVSPRRSSDR